MDGFTRMARLFLEHREEMAAPGGPLDAFADSEVRIIVRPTRYLPWRGLSRPTPERATSRPMTPAAAAPRLSATVAA